MRRQPPPVAPGTRQIVLDTAALIAGTDALYALGGLTEGGAAVVPRTKQALFFVTPDVAAEVRDVRARERLAALHRVGCVRMRAPSAEAVAVVAAFARRTGDYAVLSMADLRVLALCYMLEVEAGGVGALDLEGVGLHVTEVWKRKGVAFEEVERREKEEAEKAEAERREAEEGADGWVTVVKAKPVEKKEKKSKNKNKKKKKKKKKKEVEEMEEAIRPPVSEMQVRGQENGKVDLGHERQSAQDGTVREDGISEKPASTPVSSHEADEAWPADGEQPPTDHRSLQGELTADSLPIEDLSLKPASALESVMPTPVVGEIERTAVLNQESATGLDDDVGWINEDNLEEHLARDGGEEEMTEEERQRVACVTTDFALQNTMLQMGLKLLSVDGRRTIRQIRHYALRCHSCNEITRELQRRFCDRCGNATMHRVAFRVDKKGVARFFLNPKKKPLLRGSKYPIPMPRGGRHNTDLILCEDQIDPVQQRRIQKQRERMNVDVLDPTNFYNAGAKFNPHDRPLVVGYGRRNPNEVRATRKAKR